MVSACRGTESDLEGVFVKAFHKCQYAYLLFQLRERGKGNKKQSPYIKEEDSLNPYVTLVLSVLGLLAIFPFFTLPAGTHL